MIYKYLVTLRRDSERTTDVLSILLCFVSSFIFLFAAWTAAYREGASNTRTNFLYVAGLVLLTGVIINFIRGRKGKIVRYRLLLLFAALGWLGMPVLPWLGVLFFLLAFLEYQTKRPLEIGFDHDRVVINTLIRRRYAWTDFSNIILKDGLLTLDFANNRLLQREVVDEEDEDDADEDEFNDYCREQLNLWKSAVPASDHK